MIGIIALLIAILLPALTRAREMSKRAVCLSNLRQIYLAEQLYALDNKDAVLVGYRINPMYNTTLYSNTAATYTLFGWLYPAGLMRQGRAWYCPSESNPKYMFDTPENRWPPGPPANAARLSNAGYASRPVWELYDTGPGAYEPTRPGTDPDSAGLKRLSGWKANRAMFADLCNGTTKLPSRHRQGLNALYGDGHAAWVGHDRFAQFYDRLPPEPFLAETPGGPTLEAASRYAAATWGLF